MHNVEMLRKLRANLPIERRGIIERGLLLLIDNAPIHTAEDTVTCIDQLMFKQIKLAPYSPDIAPQ